MLATGNRRGYFVDFGGAAHLAKAIAEGFVYDGQPSTFRRRRHGAPAAGAPGERFVVFNQNHDQIANACQGRRLAQVMGLERQKVAATVLFSTPALPLLFHGEEYAEEAPFDYFTSHSDPALAEAVRQGRHQEYLHLLEEGTEVGSWADPQAEETFQRAKLRWESIARSPHAEMLAFYRALIALRRRLPPLHNGRKDLTRVSADEAAPLGDHRARRSRAARRRSPPPTSAPRRRRFDCRRAAPAGSWRWPPRRCRRARVDGATASFSLPRDTAAVFIRVPG